MAFSGKCQLGNAWSGAPARRCRCCKRAQRVGSPKAEALPLSAARRQVSRKGPVKPLGTLPLLAGNCAAAWARLAWGPS